MLRLFDENCDFLRVKNLIAGIHVFLAIWRSPCSQVLKKNWNLVWNLDVFLFRTFENLKRWKTCITIANTRVLFLVFKE